MTPDQKIKICKKTRKYAQESLLKVLQTVLKNNLESSETELRDMWLSEIKKNNAMLEDGWYSPPPHGIGILIGTDEDGEQSRLNHKSLRPEKMWPQKDIHLNTENSIIYAYASPVDKTTGIIGDFGTTLYFGKNQEIIDHLNLCYQIVNQVFDYVEPGLTFSSIAKHLKELLDSHGLNNEIECKTDPSPADDVGHTIPFIEEDLTEKESKILKSESHDEVKQMISEKRIFVRASEEKTVKTSMAFTIEPRIKVINNPKIPMVSFHTICAIDESGKKELITGFDKIFDLVGMGYMN